MPKFIKGQSGNPRGRPPTPPTPPQAETSSSTPIERSPDPRSLREQVLARLPGLIADPDGKVAISACRLAVDERVSGDGSLNDQIREGEFTGLEALACRMQKKYHEIRPDGPPRNGLVELPPDAAVLAAQRVEEERASRERVKHPRVVASGELRVASKVEPEPTPPSAKDILEERLAEEVTRSFGGW